jgi:hypothetical protein
MIESEFKEFCLLLARKNSSHLRAWDWRAVRQKTAAHILQRKARLRDYRACAIFQDDLWM